MSAMTHPRQRIKDDSALVREMVRLELSGLYTRNEITSILKNHSLVEALIDVSLNRLSEMQLERVSQMAFDWNKITATAG